MGKHFLMSFRFNKQSPEDFGLIQSGNENVFLKPDDGSQWKAKPLYDYGWGKENGYYKTPLPNFESLVNIILQTENEDDKYGAAAVILDDFCTELLNKCFEIFELEKSPLEYCDFFKVLHLDWPINRNPAEGKRFNTVTEDFERWKQVSIKVKKLMCEKVKTKISK